MCLIVLVFIFVVVIPYRLRSLIFTHFLTDSNLESTTMVDFLKPESVKGMHSIFQNHPMTNSKGNLQS